jgi:hypothetical protein
MSDDQRIHDMREDIGKLFTLVSETKQAMARIETKLDLAPKCPDPGACTRVEEGLEDLDSRVDKLEASEDRRIGVFATIGAICSLVGGATALLVECLRRK